MVYIKRDRKPTGQHFISIIELARALGVTRAAIYKKIRNGQIPVEKVEGRYLISREILADSTTQGLTKKTKAEIDRGVARVVKEYGETLRLLGKE